MNALEAKARRFAQHRFQDDFDSEDVQYCDLALSQATPAPVEPQGEIDAVSVETARLINKSKSENTIKAYQFAISKLQDWLNGQSPTDARIADYLTDLFSQGKSPATCAQIVSAIQYVAKAEGVQNPVGTLTRATLQGINREGKTRGRGQATGIKYDDALTMARIADSADHTAPIPAYRKDCTSIKETTAKARIRQARDSAIIRTMANCLLRISELCAVQCEHIETDADGTGALLIPHSKTDQEGEGKQVYLQKATVKAIRKYQRLSGVTEGALFRRIYQNCTMGNRPLSVNAVRDIIKDLARKAKGLEQIDIDLNGISGHSFRVGTAQTFVERKGTMPQLQTAGRWKDTRMPARYTEKESLKDGAIATVLGE